MSTGNSQDELADTLRYYAKDYPAGIPSSIADLIGARHAALLAERRQVLSSRQIYRFALLVDPEEQNPQFLAAIVEKGLQCQPAEVLVADLLGFSPASKNKYDLVIMFGKTKEYIALARTPVNQIITISGQDYLAAPSLDDIKNDSLLKRAFWAMIKNYNDPGS